MAHFYGTLKGNRGEVSRTGSKRSGVHTVAASWQGAVEVYITYDPQTGEDVAHVALIPWHGRGTTKVLYQGPVSGGGQ